MQHEWEEEECIQDFGREDRRKESTRAEVPKV
jgi:hypothetical protein